jgi:hypothetical protein
MRCCKLSNGGTAILLTYAKNTLVEVMRGNAGENKSKRLWIFYSVGVRNRSSTAHEQWQNGIAEAALNSIMRLARTVMAESGLGGRFQSLDIICFGPRSRRAATAATQPTGLAARTAFEVLLLLAALFSLFSK